MYRNKADPERDLGKEMLIEDFMESANRMEKIDQEIKKLELMKQREQAIQISLIPDNETDDRCKALAAEYIVSSGTKKGMSPLAIREQIRIGFDALDQLRFHFKDDSRF